MNRELLAPNDLVLPAVAVSVGWAHARRSGSASIK
jgi:hypothetical protein